MFCKIGALRNFKVDDQIGVLKKETLAQVFSCEFCDISKSNFSYGTPPDDCLWNVKNTLYFTWKVIFVHEILIFFCIFLYFLILLPQLFPIKVDEKFNSYVVIRLSWNSKYNFLKKLWNRYDLEHQSQASGKPMVKEYFWIYLEG